MNRDLYAEYSVIDIAIYVETDLYAGADAGLPLNVSVFWIQKGYPTGEIDRQLVIPVGPLTLVSGSGSSTLALAFRPARHTLTNPAIGFSAARQGSANQ